jgi:rhamnose transport system permease protein
MPRRIDWGALIRWETLLAVVLAVVVLFNISQSPVFLRFDNLINLFVLHGEKILVVLIMALVIINGEIDLSVASIMGLSAALLAYLYAHGVAMEVAILIVLGAGILTGVFNAFWIVYVGLPSLVVTLAGLIGYRGLAKMLVEDRSIGSFPAWFNQLGQRGLAGSVPLSIILFFVLLVTFTVVLHYTAFGRYVIVIGNNRDAARYSGVRVHRVKIILFVLSAFISSLAGILFAARLGSVRASTAEGFELDIITIALLGGVSIFGGKGTMVGVGLSILLVLALRNGMNLLSITGNTQSTVIGVLLILSVLIPNVAQDVRGAWKRFMPQETASERTVKEVFDKPEDVKFSD